MASPSSVVYDGFEFKEPQTMKRYASLKRRLTVSTFVSLATVCPAMVFLVLNYVSPSSSSPYLYLVFLGISIPFSVVSFMSNSKITEIVNSNEVRHVGFR